jgi:hypothetical protein
LVRLGRGHPDRRDQEQHWSRRKGAGDHAFAAAPREREPAPLRKNGTSLPRCAAN